MSSSQPQSGELILWLKTLDLPVWAKVILAAIMGVILISAATVLGLGLYNLNKEEISSGASLFAYSLPILVIITTLIFGSNAESALQKRTSKIIEELIPKCIRENTQSSHEQLSIYRKIGAARQYSQVDVECVREGCIGEYVVDFKHTQSGQESINKRLEFSVELNVHKVNVVIWIDKKDKSRDFHDITNPDDLRDLVGANRMHCIAGATLEGYKLNNYLKHTQSRTTHYGLLLVRELPTDFLLQAQDTLYFSQDLAFFIRGLIDAEVA